jgi:rod shape determining protein RodA
MRADARVSFRSGPQVDMPLVVGVVAIATLGVVNLYSATSPYTDARATMYVSQIYWIAVGLLLSILVAAIDYRFFERLATLFYLGGLVALGLVFVLATDIRGSSRWIQLGSFSFQPSEFMKIFMILLVAKHLHNEPKNEPRTLFDLALPTGIVAAPVVAVMAQPDLGTSMIYLLTAASMMAMTRISRATLVSLAFAGSAAAVITYKYLLRDYQLLRIESFLNPHADKSGAGYHAAQSLTAIGNGGLTGEGLMQGTQNQFGFLPDQHSDFPFSVFAEEWGLLGSLVLLSLYCFVCVWSVHIASEAKDRFGAALAIGVGAMVFWHTVFNVGMAIGLLPVVGITLPLFSYGGSSVVTMLMGLGLMMNVSMRR